LFPGQILIDEKTAKGHQANNKQQEFFHGCLHRRKISGAWLTEIVILPSFATWERPFW
jgi:hypothetical protein